MSQAAIGPAPGSQTGPSASVQLSSSWPSLGIIKTTDEVIEIVNIAEIILGHDDREDIEDEDILQFNTPHLCSGIGNETTIMNS